MQVEVQFLLGGGESEGVLEGIIERAALKALEREGGEGASLSVIVVDDGYIRELNRQYRGIDASTDVLSFGGDVAGFVDAPGSGGYLGDVVISYPCAARQAAEFGHGVEAELALLVVHGVLHLLGYDHADEEERRDMWARQDGVLRHLGFEEAARRE